MKKLALMIGLAFSSTALGASAQAGEKKLKQADVPKPVMTTLAAKYPGAKWKGFGTEEENGATIYEAEFTQGKNDVSVDVSVDGKILAEETVIAAADLPAPVKGGIDASKYKTWKRVKAEKVIEEEKTDAPKYEVMVENKGSKFELVLDKDGKIAKETAKGKKDKD